ncbi:MAG: SDR family oxidoreductase [Verrucomicrobiota bacterium]
MAKVLISGGLGNLGTWLTRQLIDEGYNVFVASRRQRVIPNLGGYHHLPCDLSDLDQCRAQIRNLKFNFVIHLASADDQYDDLYPQRALLTNALGTRNLLEATSGTDLKNFVYFSTFHIYGRSEGSITETATPCPRHDYATTHLFAEEYVRQFHRTHNTPYTILRLTNSYGCPHNLDTDKWHLILNDLSRMAVQQNELRINGNALSERDFIWMGDVTKAVHLILESNDSFNDTYNLSGENTLRLIDVADRVRKAYEATYGEQIPIITNKANTKAANDSLKVSSDKLRRKIDLTLSDKTIEEATKIMVALTEPL